MNKNITSFPVSFEKISQIGDGDDRFTRVKINILHLGSNFNGSVFEKPIVDEAIKTLAYIPIVGFIEEDRIFDERDFSDHRYVLTRTVNGVEEKYAGHGYGVILSSADNNAHYEDVLCSDGEVRTFLCVEGVLWNMFEDMIDIFKRDINKNQSMELYIAPSSYDGYEDENGLYHFTKFSFRASCILGNNCEPAMIDSEIKTHFSISDFSMKLQDEFLHKYNSYERIKNKIEGDIQMAEVKDTELNPVVDDTKPVDESTDEIATSDVVDGVTDAPVVNDSNEEADVISKDKAEVESDVEESSEDESEKEDVTETNFESKIAELQSELDELKGQYASLEQSNSELQQNYDAMKIEYDKFVEQDNERRRLEIDKQKDAEIDKYAIALDGNAEYENIRANKANMTLDDIINRCAIAFAKANLKTNFSMSGGTGKCTTGLVDDDFGVDKNYSSRYGRIVTSK